MNSRDPKSGASADLLEISTVLECPSFFVTNDLDAPAESIVLRYAQRWRIENGTRISWLGNKRFEFEFH